MSDAPLEERLAAVERALTEGDGSSLDLAASDREVLDRVETLEEDLAKLEAAVQAVRGYVGSVKHVNDEVERRADAAMAKADAVERALADGEIVPGAKIPGATDSTVGGTADDGVGGTADDGDGGIDDDGAKGADGDPAGAATDQVRERIVDRRTDRTCDRCAEPGGDFPAGTDPGDNSPHGGGNGGRRAAAGTGASCHRADQDGLHPPSGDRDRDRGQPNGPGRDRIGHRRLEDEDEADGLLARLREVL